MKKNVLDLHLFKEHREVKRTEETYQRYLKSLANSQLEGEVNHLLEEFSQDSYGKEFYSKGKLILNEISSRASDPVKTKIDLMNEETFRLL
jgi:hypothetical protein